MSPISVLLVDADLGFLLWLGRLLADAGYDTVPARNVAGAHTIRHQLNPDVSVDVLVVSGSLTGAGMLVTELCRSYRQMKVIVVLDSGTELRSDLEGADLVLQKPSATDELSAEIWLEAIARLSGPQDKRNHA